jgi:hypothetical protein
MRVDHYVHFDPLIITEQSAASVDALAALTAAVNDLRKDIETMSATQSQLDADIADLQSKVAANTSESQSAVTLMNGIPGMISDAVSKAVAAGASPTQLAAITALGDALAANTTGLAGAVTANTPSAPTA